MIGARKVALSVGFALGLALLVGPLYLSPAPLLGETTATTYEVERIDTPAEAEQVLFEAESALLCGADSERACALERQILENGSLTRTDVRQTDSETFEPYQFRDSRYSVVEIDGDWYVPVAEQSGDATTLSLTEVSTMATLDSTAVSAANVDEAAREGIENGEVRVHDRKVPVFERGEPVQHDGEIYAATEIRSDGGPDQRLLAGRVLLFGLGAVLVGWMWVLAVGSES